MLLPWTQGPRPRVPTMPYRLSIASAPGTPTYVRTQTNFSLSLANSSLEYRPYSTWLPPAQDAHLGLPLAGSVIVPARQKMTNSGRPVSLASAVAVSKS